MFQYFVLPIDRCPQKSSFRRGSTWAAVYSPPTSLLSSFRGRIQPPSAVGTHSLSLLTLPPKTGSSSDSRQLWYVEHIYVYTVYRVWVQSIPELAYTIQKLLNLVSFQNWLIPDKSFSFMHFFMSLCHEKAGVYTIVVPHSVLCSVIQSQLCSHDILLLSVVLCDIRFCCTILLNW